MTTTKSKPADKADVERIERPAKAWYNWWRASNNSITKIGRRRVRRGEVYQGATRHPSKDVAETWVAREPRVSEWLGAFPDGTRP